MLGDESTSTDMPMPRKVFPVLGIADSLTGILALFFGPFQLLEFCETGPAFQHMSYHESIFFGIEAAGRSCRFLQEGMTWAALAPGIGILPNEILEGRIQRFFLWVFCVFHVVSVFVVPLIPFRQSLRMFPPLYVSKLGANNLLLCMQSEAGMLTSIVKNFD